MNFMEVGSFRLIPALVSTVGILALFLSGCGSCSGSMLSGDAAERGEAGNDVSGADDISSADEHVEDTAYPPEEIEEIPDSTDLPDDISCIERPTHDDLGEVPVVTWLKEYGGESGDQPKCIRQTPDGGFVAVGHTYSFGVSYYAFWILRLDAQGGVMWQKALDGPNYELGSSIDIVPDGGFIVTGSIEVPSPLERDFMVVKLTENGELEWTQMFGCANTHDEYPAIIASSDGGFLFAGSSVCLGMGGELAIWIVRLDTGGSILWEKMYKCGLCPRQCGDCVVRDVRQTADGGFVAAGRFFDGDVSLDFLVLKIDGMGNVQWKKAYGGTGYDGASGIIQTPDCGYVVAGGSNSPDSETEDALVIKIDADGRLVHYGSLGRDKDDTILSVDQTPDGGFVFGGSARLDDLDFRAWILKTDPMFNIVWQYLYGEGDVWSLRYTSDGGLVAVCRGFAEGIPGDSDFRIIKMDGSGYPGEDCPDEFWIPSTAVSGSFPVMEKDVPVDVTETHAHLHEADTAVIDTAAEASSVCGR